MMMSCTVVTDAVKTKKMFVSIKQRFSDYEICLFRYY